MNFYELAYYKFNVMSKVLVLVMLLTWDVVLLNKFETNALCH